MRIYVLVVDDDENIRISLRGLLENAGYHVGEARDAESAKEILGSGDFAVVVTDIILPRGNGLSLLKFAKEASSHRQVILITDAPSIETASEAVRLGASDYLVKPIGKEQFLLSQAKAVDARGLTPEREVEDTTSEFNPKQLENLLQKSENRLKEVQKMAQLGSWEWNLRQNIVLWSDEMYSIYGFPKGSPPNRGAIRELVVPEDRNIFDGAFQNRTKGEV